MAEVNETLRSARVSSYKARLVANQIRGKQVEEALDILTFDLQKSAPIIKKVLESAIANAENNHQLDVDKLYVHEASVGKGLVMKRFRARAKGRGARILKHFSNLTIKLKEQIEKKQKEKNIKKDQKKDMKEEKK